MNLPNKLTTLRLLIVVVMTVIYCVFSNVAWVMYTLMALFIVGSFTDFLDGVIARKYNMVTGFGKLMDPLADKLLVISAILILINASVPYLYWWVALIVIARELFVLGIRLAAIEGDGKVIAADKLGKLKTMTQMISISVLFLYSALILSYESTFVHVMLYVSLALFYVSVLLCVISGIQYFILNKKYFKMR